MAAQLGVAVTEEAIGHCYRHWLSWIGLATQANRPRPDDGAFIQQDTTAGTTLKFDLKGLGSSGGSGDILFDPLFGFDQPSQVIIELDLINNVATGTVIDPVRGTSTVSEAISALGVIDALTIDRVSMHQRFQGWDVDNILVTETPEPSTLALVAAGLLCLNLVGWRKRS